MPSECNLEDGEGRCTADDGFPCAACEQRQELEYLHYRTLYDMAPLSERDPDRYRSEMLDAGRGHLLSRDPTKRP